MHGPGRPRAGPLMGRATHGPGCNVNEAGLKMRPVTCCYSKMSEYGPIDNIKRKIRDNVLKTEPKDASKNLLWQNFVAIFEEVDN